MTPLTNFPTPQTISVNSITLEVFEAGAENAGNPIVLCHGWPEHAYSWRYQIPALVAAGYHVIVPNQRGFGASSRPEAVTDYDITKLTGDLLSLLDHYGYDDAVFVGHDWGANNVWCLALLHPASVRKIINLALPYQARGEVPWITFMESAFGRQRPLGDPLMTEEALSVFVNAFERSGFTGGINWYRNLDRNWKILESVDPIIKAPSLMIYGEQDMIPQSDRLSHFVLKVDVESLPCGHWIQQEMPEETNRLILNWLAK